MITLPRTALSVRQPWAWAIIHAGKDIENRTALAVSKGGMQTGRVAIHTGKGMTREEYAEAAAFMAKCGVKCPAPAELQRGGIIGSVEVVAIVRHDASKWFFGPRGLVLRDPRPCEFIAAPGALGFFAWRAGGALEQPLPWMLRASSPARDLFG